MFPCLPPHVYFLNAEGSADSSSGINTAISVVIVGVSRIVDSTAGLLTTKGGWEAVLWGADNDGVNLLIGEAGVGSEDEGDHTSNRGASHGGTRERGIEVITRGTGAGDLGTWGGDIGLNDLEAGGAGARTTAGEAGEGVGVIGGADSNHGVKVSGGVGGGAVGARVALGEDGDDPSGPPGINIGLVPIITIASSPRVRDDISALGAISSGAIKPGGAEDELGRSSQIRLGAKDSATTLGGKPRDPRGHTHPRGLRSRNSSHSVSSMAISISRGRGATGIVPVVIVGEGGVLAVSTVVREQGGVGVPHSSVNVGNHDSAAGGGGPGNGGLGREGEKGLEKELERRRNEAEKEEEEEAKTKRKKSRRKKEAERERERKIKKEE